MENKVKISTQNLNLYYGENHALKNINLDLYENKDHCIYRTIRMWKIYVFKNIKPYE